MGDYNEGFILAAAIDKYVVIAGCKTSDVHDCSVASSSYPDSVVSFSAADSPEKQVGSSAWANYVIGVVSELNKLGLKVGGFKAFLTSNVPPGAGVSSSAAVEMATAKLLAALFPETVGKLDDLALIKAAKAAENNFVGMGCGILDQFSSGMGRSGNLIFLDCRTLEYSYAPFVGGEFVLANTHAPHQLVDGKYDELRTCCFAAAKGISESAGDAKLTHLRDVSPDVFRRHSGQLSEGELKRAQHIIDENERVHKGIAAITKGDLATLGDCMTGSHMSSQLLFGNSCPELDSMVGCAKTVPGFLGGRLMGGGFGGSTINLVEKGKGEAFAQELAKRYEGKSGCKPTVLICVPGDGACNEILSC